MIGLLQGPRDEGVLQVNFVTSWHSSAYVSVQEEYSTTLKQHHLVDISVRRCLKRLLRTRYCEVQCSGQGRGFNRGSRFVCRGIVLFYCLYSAPRIYRLFFMRETRKSTRSCLVAAGQLAPAWRYKELNPLETTIVVHVAVHARFRSSDD